MMKIVTILLLATLSGCIQDGGATDDTASVQMPEKFGWLEFSATIPGNSWVYADIPSNNTAGAGFLNLSYAEHDPEDFFVLADPSVIRQGPSVAPLVELRYATSEASVDRYTFRGYPANSEFFLFTTYPLEIDFAIEVGDGAGRLQVPVLVDSILKTETDWSLPGPATMHMLDFDRDETAFDAFFVALKFDIGTATWLDSWTYQTPSGAELAATGAVPGFTIEGPAGLVLGGDIPQTSHFARFIDYFSFCEPAAPGHLEWQGVHAGAEYKVIHIAGSGMESICSGA